MIKKRLLAIGLAAAQVLASPAMAFDFAQEVKVTRMAITNFPEQIYFQVDAAVGNCVAGTWLVYAPGGSSEARQVAQAQFVASVLLTGLNTGRKVAIFGLNNGCTVQFIDLLRAS